eukprot:TRINITY_DN2146_c0_g1_i7.p1 TRINITY_DN2146_c0_g1~~TRINITY_DN2146_c0_g1_i7.p1  ORF type:complete len:585 (-),score=68.40 TRINITY_DN2146_c0_g1_i7:123-1877(-)
MKAIRFVKRIRGRNNRAATTASTRHINPPVLLTRTRRDGNQETSPEVANIKLFGHSREVRLTTLRMILVLANLVVLAASFVSYLAWMDAKYNWQMVNTERPNRNILAAMKYLPVLSPSAQKIVSSVHGNLDQLLYLTAFNLFLYWVIYGFIISCRFGGTCDICTIVVSLPHTVIMVVWEIGIASAILRVNSIFSSLPWDELKRYHSQHFEDLRYLNEFYSGWGPVIVTLYFLCVPVQIFLVCLPFLVSRLPFQSDFQNCYQPNRKDDTDSIASDDNEHTPTQESSIAPETAGKRRRRSLAYFFSPSFSTSFPMAKLESSPTSTPQNLSSARIQGSERNLAGEEMVSVTRLPQSCDGEQTEDHVATSSLHLRPGHQSDEAFRRMGNQRRESLADWTRNSCRRIASNQYECATRAISAGKAVIETMNRAYHVHNSSRPLWNLLDRPVRPHPRLQERDFLAGGISIYNPRGNYLNMARHCSPPPPYSLHQDHHQLHLDNANNLESSHQPHPEHAMIDIQADDSSYVDIDLNTSNDDFQSINDFPAFTEEVDLVGHRNYQRDTSMDIVDDIEGIQADTQNWSETSIII